MKHLKKLFLVVLSTVICLISTSTISASTVGDLKVRVDNSFSIIPGKTGTINVSFSGMGIDSIGVVAAGNGLSASVSNTRWAPYPNTCSATINLSTTNNFNGGTVTFQMKNNSRGTILTRTINIHVDYDVRLLVPAAYSIKPGNNGTTKVLFSGRGIDAVDVVATGFGLSASVSNTRWAHFPGECSSDINLSTTSNFRSGIVTFRLINNFHGVIQTKSIIITPK